MKGDSSQADQFERRLYAVLILAGILIAIPILGIWHYLDSRLDTLAENLDYQLPASSGRALELEQLPWAPIQGQKVYVPAYSHIYHQRGQALLLTITLSIRNTDPETEIVVSEVDYYDSNGRLVRKYTEQPLSIGPLASAEFVVARDDKTGGSGASFLVGWSAGQPVSQPIIEAIMIDTNGQQGISFVRSGTAIDDFEEHNN